MTGKAINIALLPDKEIQQKAIEFSERISKLVDTEFTLNKTTFLPHITIYQGYYPNKNINPLFNAVEEFVSNESSLRVEMNEIQISFETFIFWRAQKTKTLQDFHGRVLKLANPFREGLIPQNVKDMIPFLSKEEQEVVRNTGSILNKQFFLPHITITRLKKAKDVKKVIDFLGRADDKTFFEAKKLTLTDIGDHGTVSKILAEFNLK